MRPSETEKAKLTATYANGVAIALAAIGGVAPLVAAFLQGVSADVGRIAVGVGVCLACSLALHVVGRRFLNRLDG